MRFGVTERHFRRVRRRFEAEGDGVVMHGLRGSRLNRSLPSETRERVLAIARDPNYAGFGPTLLGEHAERVLGVRASMEYGAGMAGGRGAVGAEAQASEATGAIGLGAPCEAS